jgi:hypothetical protein
MTSPTTMYAKAHQIVAEALQQAEGNDKSRMAYLIARAGMLAYRDIHGPEHTAETFYGLADENTAGGGRGDA